MDHTSRLSERDTHRHPPRLRRAGSPGVAVRPGARPRAPAWLADERRWRPRARPDEPGQYLALRGRRRAAVVARLRASGRGSAAPGRRHPLRRPDRLAPPRADRAPGGRRARARRPRLNGVFVNGERVEWSALHRRRRDRRRPPPPALRRHRDRRRRAPRRPTPPSREPSAAAWPHASPRRVYRAAPMAETIAVLSQKGGTGKTTTVRTLTDVLRRVGLRRARRRPRPAGQPVGLLRRRPPDAAPDDRRRAARATPRPPRRVHDGIIPANARSSPRRALAVGQDGPRAGAAEGAQGRRATSYDVILDRLPAGARPADRQRARRRRLGAACPPRRSTSRCRASSRRSR